MRSSTAVGLADAFGRFTSIPRYIMGAVSMKIRSNTSTTSTSGMMLISAKLEPIRAPPSEGSDLNILRRPRYPRGGATQEIEQVEHEAVHLRGPVPDAIHEEVVAHDG